MEPFDMLARHVYNKLDILSFIIFHAIYILEVKKEATCEQ